MCDFREGWYLTAEKEQTTQEKKWFTTTSSLRSKPNPDMDYGGRITSPQKTRWAQMNKFKNSKLNEKILPDYYKKSIV